MTNPPDFPNRAAAAEASDDDPLSPEEGETIGDVIFQRYNRRDVMRGTLGAAAAATFLFGPAALAAQKTECTKPAGTFSFDEVAAGANKDHHVAEGYDAKVLLRWGDALCPDMPPFDPCAQSADDQLKRFGYNNDYIAYFPIDGSSTHGLICVNHEYTNEELMFPGLSKESGIDNFEQINDVLVDIEMAAHGVSIVEIQKNDDGWSVVHDSKYNRRITPNTKMTFDGPAKEHPYLHTQDDRNTGTSAVGTLNNCAGGKTPWGTYLTAEENFHGYFWTENIDANYKPVVDCKHPHKERYERYRIPSRWQAWGKYHERFDIDKTPDEPFRFGWIVEIDPFEPHSTPVKHTALGRFFHEGAETVLSKDGRAVVYSGDDAAHEYVYRFVSAERFVEGDKAHNMRLLSEGTLSVAKFKKDGTGVWCPLKFGEGKLTEAFSEGLLTSEADVLINARQAGDLAGGTKMDRPEDVQPNETSTRVYVMLTNNRDRSEEDVDAANPRADNRFGHIIEMIPDGEDFAADTFTWDILVRCGDPAKTELGAYWNAATSKHSWFVCPDNATVDDQGRLWIATDQGRHWQETGRADGLFALETDGIRRGTPRMFFRVPVGAELCGPCFTPDGETLFVAVQHPGADGVDDYAGFHGPSNFDNPATRWPDFDPEMPPRPSVMVIAKKGGGKIG